MDDFPPYTEEDWRRDVAVREAGDLGALECPDCGFSGDPYWFGPRDDGQGRHYRACKRCGFWQEADGSPAYRCWLALHLCEGVRPNGRVLGPREDGYDCEACGTRVTRAHRVPWPAARHE